MHPLEQIRIGKVVGRAHERSVRQGGGGGGDGRGYRRGMLRELGSECLRECAERASPRRRESWRGHVEDWRGIEHNQCGGSGQRAAQPTDQVDHGVCAQQARLGETPARASAMGRAPQIAPLCHEGAARGVRQRVLQVDRQVNLGQPFMPRGDGPQDLALEVPADHIVPASAQSEPLPSKERRSIDGSGSLGGFLDGAVARGQRRHLARDGCGNGRGCSAAASLRAAELLQGPQRAKCELLIRLVGELESPAAQGEQRAYRSERAITAQEHARAVFVAAAGTAAAAAVATASIATATIASAAAAAIAAAATADAAAAAAGFSTADVLAAAHLRRHLQCDMPRALS